jgi:N-hydroxyarylamine O-acetyltransferase
MSSGADLVDRYLARIGYRGERVPTLAVLRELHELHPLAIAFENLDPFLGRRVSVDVDSIAAKLVERRRGGYCFEHNTLFAQVLTQFGFHVTPLAARVLFGRAPDAITARTHMLLRVDIDDAAWIADVGFGGVTLCAPLALDSRDAQPTPHEPARIDDAPDRACTLSVKIGEAWKPVYRFDAARAEPIDFEVANWYTSTSPDVLFTNHLLVCRPLARGRATLFNDRYCEYDLQWRRREKTLGSARELDACLRERFGIDTDEFDLDALHARIKGRGASV